ncbi:MAG: DUF2169 domain-containing protein [Planctomycetota bacterium]
MDIKNRTPFAFAPVMGWVNFPSHTATLVVKAGFRIMPDGVCEPLDEQPSFEGDVMSKASEPECLYDADLAQYKPHADVLLSGSCHAPGGKAVTATTATFRVGDWSKSVACIGNRTWQKGLIRSTMSEPEPFTKVAITWHNAFGSPKFAHNPAGKGHKDVLLPNIENPNDLIGGAGDKPKPAGFGPLHRSWKHRTKKMGTYDKKWLKERFPAWPKDFDWTYFNAAPDDQQLDGFLSCTEEVVLESMNADHPVLKTKLPGIRVRCLIREGDELALREVQMNLDTMHVDADKQEIYLLWRGIADVSDGDWTACRDILVVSEKLEDKKQTHEELLPLFEEEPEEGEVEEGDEPESVEEKSAAIDKLIKEMEARAAKVEGDVSAAAKRAAGDEFDPVKQAASAPKTEYSHAVNAVNSNWQGVAGAGGKLPPGVSANDFNPAADPGMQELMKLEQAMKPPRPTEPGKLAAMMKSGEAKGGDFGGAELKEQDLEGSDLSESFLNDADLSGANLKGADLNGASLSNANLSNADLSGADLSEADLTGADLSGAKLDGANLSESVLMKTKADGASFKGVKAVGAIFAEMQADGGIFSEGDFTQAVFSDVSLVKADFTGSILKNAAFDGVNATEAIFTGAVMPGFRGGEASDFTKAKVDKVNGTGSVWEKSTLVETDFAESELGGALFPDSNLTGARLFGANLTRSVMRKAVLKGAKCGNTNFFRAMLEQADLTEASLVNANCYEADFMDAKTEGTNFEGANLKMTKLAK